MCPTRSGHSVQYPPQIVVGWEDAGLSSWEGGMLQGSVFVSDSCPLVGKLHFSAWRSLTTSTWAMAGISLCHASVVGRKLSTQPPPMSTLVLLKGTIRNSTTSGLCMPATRAASEPPLSIVVPGARLALVSPSKIVINVSLMSIFP